MNEEIMNHFQKKLLQNPMRVMDENGEIKEIYDHPERSKREDRDFDRRCHEFMDDIWESRMRCSEHDSNVVREVQ